MINSILLNVIEYIREWITAFNVTSSNPTHWFYEKSSEIFNKIEDKLRKENKCK